MLSRAPQRLVVPIAALLSATLSVACYDTVPLRPVGAAPMPLRDVELTLTDSGSVVVARTIGAASTAVLGTLVADSAGTYLISVRQVRRRAGDPVPWAGERVGVPHALVASARQRRLARTRTVLTTLGAVAGVVAIGAIAHNRTASNSGKSGSGGITGPK